MNRSAMFGLASLLALSLLVPVSAEAGFPHATLDGAEAYLGDLVVRSVEQGYLVAVTSGEETLTVLYRTNSNFPEVSLEGPGLLLLSSHSAIVRVAGEELTLTVGDSNGGPDPMSGYEILVFTTSNDANSASVAELGATAVETHADQVRSLLKGDLLSTAFDVLGGPASPACPFEGGSCSVTAGARSCRAICAEGYSACCSLEVTCECRR